MDRLINPIGSACFRVGAELLTKKPWLLVNLYTGRLSHEASAA